MGFGYRSIRTVCLIATASLIALVAGCSKAPVSGVFVDKVSPKEVDMVRVVEAPPGHLTGSLVLTTLNQKGSSKTANYSVSGSINGTNISLQVGGGVAELARLFGANTLLVGSLKGQTLTLSNGNSLSEFHKVSEQKYQRDLSNLTITGQHRALVYESTKALRDVISYDQDMNVDLQHYLVWGQTRIDRVPDVRAWYANRISQYTMCLNHIRPLAAAHVPPWQWQECVLNMNVDKYYRDQEVADLRNLQEQDQQDTKHLYAKLREAKIQFATAIHMFRSSCPYRQLNAGKCMVFVRKLHAMGSYGVINTGLLSKFNIMVPKVKAAINEDIATGSTGEAKLSGMAQQASNIYRSGFGQ